MNEIQTPVRCRSCSQSVAGTYCSHCGIKVEVKRITLPDLLHEVFHFFTHLDKGFPYTLKKLIVAPGQMQKAYMEGDRSRHQKPFSMFFVAATISALIYYWVNKALLQFWSAGNQHEAEFFNHYWVLFHICLFPAYALITYLCFKKAGYNYGEVAVFQLYTFSLLFLLVSSIQVFKFLNPSLETRYIELPILLLYTTISNLHFFTRIKRFAAILLSILNLGLIFLIAATLQDGFIEMLSKK
ncbi:MAG TPA: DUF3667 domain-containing protein [Flavisolibacter sp.]|jgi:hypothetical protein|nr:DUF3667 domain-containing protein [Flavisolibacter sp.]